jgi:calcineurin-like phosphoesterase family protein
VTGALEWWVGDPGLCSAPDHHPYLVLAEISGEEWSNIQDVMQAISRCTDSSGPIIVSVYPAGGAVNVPEFSSYQIYPSPGLRSFVLLLSDICPVIANPGSLIYSMIHGSPATFSTIQPFIPGECEARSQPSGSMNKTVSNNNEGAPIITMRNKEYEPVNIEILRIVLRKEGNPIAEYDLSRRRWLHTSESTLRKNARLSLRKFRIMKGYQITRSRYRMKPQIYVIGDLHLGHANSIPRYKRPFLLSDPREMDRILIRNWNWTVKKEDTTIFLGDLAYRGSNSIDSYLERLNGRVVFVEGNHDPYLPYMSHCLLKQYKDISYLFIHDPEELNRPFEGWVIHGHVHNRDITQYPFINRTKRMVNVSAEMIGYRPISLDEIYHLVTEKKDSVLFRDLSYADEMTENSSEQDLMFS